MHRSVMFKVAQKLRDKDFRKIILIPIVLTVIISLAFADVVRQTVVVHNTGMITSGTSEILSKSGSATDIQAAVDLAASKGGGIVRIPEGTFNFVEVGEPWKTVNVPAGVSIFGAPTERDTNDQVVAWKTVLVMPYDVPGSDSVGIPNWFSITGTSNPSKPSRFSDIKLVGYRDIDHNSRSMHTAINIESVINYRIDHCYFRHTTGGGVIISGHYCCGVIDHCYLVNVYGNPGADDYASRTIDYGVAPNRDWSEKCSSWEGDITAILGKYRDYTTVIEDCYFSKWRHCVCPNLGAHTVVRHCIFQYCWGFSDIDVHQQLISPYSAPRATEVYDNQFIDLDTSIVDWQSYFTAMMGGCGVWFNNYVSNAYMFIYATNSVWNSTMYPKDIYIWNNSFGGDYLIYGDGNSQTENVTYFLYKPNWYTPYPYPHPLVANG